MISNYLKTAFRTLVKSPLFSTINLFGLAMSMTICLLALTVIRDAFTHDRFHPFAERTYRVVTAVKGKNGMQERWATSPVPLASELSNYTGTEKTVRVYTMRSMDSRVGDKTIALRPAFADASFFDVFGFRLKSGNPRQALKRPNTAVITEEAARLFFAAGNAVGNSIEIAKLKTSFIITGVIRNNHQKSHLTTQLYLSMASVPGLENKGTLLPMSQDWARYTANFTYVLLRPEASAAGLQQALAKIAKKQLRDHPQPYLSDYQYDLQRLDRFSPGETLINDGDTVTSSSLLVMSGITLLILLLACFNYTNLSLARSLGRAKEIGIRKVSGGTRGQLFVQFMTESTVMALLSLLISGGLLALMIAYDFVPQRMLDNLHIDSVVVLLFVAFAVFTGLLAGFLPAMLLSAFNPVQALNKLSSIRIFSGLGIQKTLTVIQFGVSLVFVIVLITVNRQTQFANSYAYGYATKNIVNVETDNQKVSALAHELASRSEVADIARSSDAFGGHPDRGIIRKTVDAPDSLYADVFYADAEFVKIMQLELVAGSVFAGEQAANEVVINETAVRNMGFTSPGAAVGQTFVMNDSVPVVISGVAKDFQYMNLKNTVGNLVMAYDPRKFTVITVKTARQDAPILGQLQRVYHRFYPAGEPLQWFDEDLRERRSYTQDTNIITFLAVMAISIACIGLLGIVTYTSQVRQKEIGIRKVLGADTGTIVYLLSKDFLRLVGIAFIFAMPAGYLLSNVYLQVFLIHVSGTWINVLGGAALLLLLAFLTISSQTLRTALANPVESLRRE